LSDWVALVPWKQGQDSKSRLSAHLDPAQRAALSRNMAEHVIARLAQVDAIGNIYLVAPQAMPTWLVHWIPDEGRGLNQELTLARMRHDGRPVIILHADLPGLEVADVEALIAGAVPLGAAIAPDRHGRGTNGLALADGRPFDFAFGPDSFALHLAQRPDARIVERPGLSFDLDTPDDLALVKRRWGLPSG
jgi:2-phospho-L-lactate guanylyltransferase